MLTREQKSVYLVLLAYILGLLLTGIDLDWLNLSNGYGLLYLIILVFTTIIGVICQQINKQMPSLKWLIIAGMVIVSAHHHYQLRLPNILDSDISYELTNYENETVEITGKIITSPQVNRSEKRRFILAVESYQNQPKTGKIYVTAPLLPTQNLFPSTKIKIIGKLYQPSPSTSPGGFNFANFLARQGIFTGFTAQEVKLEKFGNAYQQSIFWLRQRIIQTHVRYLNIPDGLLVSGMVIGSRGVDLPAYLQDSFRDAGLSHVLAASGFHVSLLLGVILSLTDKFSPVVRFSIGISALLMYVTITGFSPSVMRAGLMGLAVLLGIILQRPSLVLPSLLLSAVILLLINPLWIWDIGFQFSFLATFGLIITLPSIISRLDFLPPTIANLIAVPLSATIWILPLQGYIFNRLSLYSVITNIIATPFVLIISLGGMITGFLGLFLPVISSALTLILFPFTWLLIHLVNIVNNLPFASLAIGNLSLIIILVIYTIYLLIWTFPFWQKRWMWLGLFSLTLVIFPLIYQKLSLVQITMMEGADIPVIVIQNQRHNYLINLPNKDFLNYTLKSFFSYQGINNLDLAINNDDQNSQIALNNLTQFINLKNQEKISANSIKLKNIDNSENIVQWELNQEKWLLLKEYQDMQTFPNNIDNLIISGENLTTENIQQIQPQNIITYQNINSKLAEQLANLSINLYSLSGGRALVWQPQKGFYYYDQES
ncbi:MAG: ComEC family competence protein [Cyanobacterium sp. T60_A2020_053]|nr:ComEC family competence protein [Cyanobacterium sp. T60_A2020_053]